MSQVESAQSELIELQNEWMDAVARRDRDRLESLLAEEYTLTAGAAPGRPARVFTRAEWLEAALGGYTISAFEYEELRVDVYGEAAVVRSRYRQTAEHDGVDLSLGFLLTDVWARMDGRWQVVARHSTPVTA
ncbi:MAG TPA: nuclear transport factor 2 family protein [Gaiellales bacterium]|jgi:ketosteroid isomerase-like protein|nr:nuclear transport factor 2 family protein [Gaiellales bacterium]